MQLKNWIPALEWTPAYRADWIRPDLVAGLTVGVMLIPQGMAYAMIAGLPPIYGLYASIVPLILYAIFGTSRQLAVGPVAMISLLVATSLAPLADSGSSEYVALAILLALIAGVLQLLMGIFRLGFLVNFLSHPVISGFTSAAALIIGFSQLKHLMGIDLPRSHHVHEILGEAATHIQETNLATLAIGLGAIVVLLVIKRIRKTFPGALLVVVIGILLTWLLQLESVGVRIVGNVPEGLPPLSVPQLDADMISTLIPMALTISFIGFIESIAVAKAIQAKHRDYEVDANSELRALGIANIGGAFFSAYPVTGGFSRTAVNDQAGAKTGLASIISALLIALTLIFLTPLFYFLPKAILASIIMVAVFGLIDWKEAVSLWKTDRRDFVMLIVTFAATLLIGIEQGILIGAILSIALVVYSTSKPHYAVLGKIPGQDLYKNIERFSEVEQRPDTLIFRFDARLYYANVSFFESSLQREMEKHGADLRHLVLDFESVNSVDSTGVHSLSHLIDQLRSDGVEIYFVGLKGPVRDTYRKAGLIAKTGEDHFFLKIEHAMDYIMTNEKKQLKKYTLQNEV